ncbi:MAG TPA: hypothetical protein VGD33_12585 [Chitinophagaceae bacterium]
MKVLLALAFFSIFFSSPDPILIIDSRFKKEARYAVDFDAALLFDHKFPVYRSDVESVVHAAGEVAKEISNDLPCNYKDTAIAGQSAFYIRTSCDYKKAITVWMKTKVGVETFYLRLLKNETDLRKAQRKLLDLTAYLSNKG